MLNKRLGQILKEQESVSEFDIQEEYREDWDKFDVWQYKSHVRHDTIRAYSMANYPDEKGIIMLNVRIAMPPATAPPGTPPGKATSWMFKSPVV